MVIQGSSFNQIIMDWSPGCYITSFLEISPPEKKSFEGFYHITALRPSWSSDPDAANKLSFPIPKETPYTIFGLISQAVSEENFLKNVNDDGRMPDHGYTISSPMSHRLR